MHPLCVCAPAHSKSKQGAKQGAKIPAWKRRCLLNLRVGKAEVTPSSPVSLHSLPLGEAVLLQCEGQLPVGCLLQAVS